MAVISAKNEDVIRIISTGSMQRRFTLKEEVAIESSNDPMAKVIRSRLMNASFCDLDFKETKDGVAYIVNFLANVSDPDNPEQMLVTDVNTRVDDLLKDGTQKEKVG